jgi:hypothetical protein
MVLEPGVCGGAVVVLDVAVVLAGGKVGGDVRHAFRWPAGMGDREEILEAMPQADGSTDSGKVEPRDGIRSDRGVAPDHSEIPGPTGYGWCYGNGVTLCWQTVPGAGRAPVRV